MKKRKPSSAVSFVCQVGHALIDLTSNMCVDQLKIMLGLKNTETVRQQTENKRVVHVETFSNIIATGFPATGRLNEEGLATIAKSYEVVFEQVFVPAVRAHGSDQFAAIDVPRKSDSVCAIL
jgi:hypothetical protein